MKFHGFGFLSNIHTAWIPIMFLTSLGVYFLTKGFNQINKPSQEEIGRTNIVFSIILLAMCAAVFWWFYIK